MNNHYKEIIKNNSVLIIGGASNFVIPEKDYPVVISCNKAGDRLNPQLHGHAHWRVLYHNCDKDVGIECLKFSNYCCYNLTGECSVYVKEYCKQNNIELVPMVHQRFKDKNPFGQEHEWLQVVMQTFGFYPFTGIIALLDVLCNCSCEQEVYVTGMDLFRKQDVLPARVGKHFLSQNVAMLKYLKAGFDNLVFDSQLELALELPIEKSDNVVLFDSLKKRLDAAKLKPVS